ncbi:MULTISPECIES: DUF2949 domain-containing protein [Cyanophyceae]|uniref:DUF2949 domain-containing protein n=1 Tax=Pseudocalidococcus azoricus BACA0444 TaxID=2918990 RepID=A0AAE4FSN1_9CYAN|nr:MULTISPECIES: DUF2949 domain-containing protein [Cyanophyceae]AFY60950.1 Protein of unknown function (DUF2949) [Synechococcus sp. PCC 6312]MDS3860230.1 DUF2949 domain-containing protein [Pseudocalidococcus azoricus BACA0444]
MIKTISSPAPLLLNYLKQDLSLSPESIDLAMRQWRQSRGPLPIILWQYGLITLAQLDQLYDWLDQHPQAS